MTNTQAQSETAVEPPKARGVDMKLEVVVIPVSDVDRAKHFYASWAGGSTATSSAVTTSASCSSRLRARRPRSSSARASPRRRPARRRVSTSSSRTSRQRAAELHQPRRRGERRVPCAAVRRQDEPMFGRHRVSGRIQSMAATLVCNVQGSGRQRLAAAGDHRATARTRRRYRHEIHLADRARSRAAARGGSPRRARETDRRPARCELAGLVRRIHRRGAGRQTAADLAAASGLRGST